MNSALKSNLEKYCLNKKNISTILKSRIIDYKDVPTEIKTKKDIRKKPRIFNKDVLFWMYYIFYHGLDRYEMIGKNKYSEEMKEKTNLIKKIKENKSILKQNKLKMSDIESDLLYSKKIKVETLFIILYIHKINFIYYTDSIIYLHKSYENDKTMYIYYDKKNNIYEEKKEIDIEELMKSRLKIDLLAKPLRAISYYKANDIKEMCKILNISIMKNAVKTYTKKELYEKIVQKIN